MNISPTKIMEQFIPDDNTMVGLYAASDFETWRSDSDCKLFDKKPVLLSLIHI